MKILLLSIGSRGDVEPFIAIGQILQKKGHEIICSFPEQFRDLVAIEGWDFFSLGSEFLALLDSDDGKIVVGGCKSHWKKILAFIRLTKVSMPMQKILLERQQTIVSEGHFDRIIFHPKAVYPLIWSLKHKRKATLIVPVPYLHSVKDHPYLGIKKNFGQFINGLTYSIANFGFALMLKKCLKWLKIDRRYSLKTLLNHFLETKTIYTISPSLFKRPDYWPQNLQVFGFNEKKSNGNCSPYQKEIDCFITKHKKVLFITFGSMTNIDPLKNTELILEICQKQKIPALINTGKGGLKKPLSYDKNLFLFVPSSLDKEVFPKVHGVMHHGGSGTTHMGLRHGCSTLIIPHIVDQFSWNDLVYKLGVGPKGVPIDKISMNLLEPKILDLWKNPLYKEEAEKIAKAMKKEDYQESLCQMILNDRVVLPEK